MKCPKCGSDLMPLVTDMGFDKSEFYCRKCNKSHPMPKDAWDYFQSTKSMKRVPNVSNR